MNLKGWTLVIILAALVITLACGLPFGRDTGGDVDKPLQAEKMDEKVEEHSTTPLQGDEVERDSPAVNGDFPLPPQAQNLIVVGEGAINYQVKMSLEEVVKFYRTTLGGQGLTEREILTVISDTTFNMAFDGSPNGKAIIIQGVDLGNGQVNVNIRYEDV